MCHNGNKPKLNYRGISELKQGDQMKPFFFCSVRYPKGSIFREIYTH